MLDSTMLQFFRHSNDIDSLKRATASIFLETEICENTNESNRGRIVRRTDLNLLEVFRRN